jgi:hypothetical protein
MVAVATRSAFLFPKFNHRKFTECDAILLITEKLVSQLRRGRQTLALTWRMDGCNIVAAGCGSIFSGHLLHLGADRTSWADGQTHFIWQLAGALGHVLPRYSPPRQSVEPANVNVADEISHRSQ